MEPGICNLANFSGRRTSTSMSFCFCLSLLRTVFTETAKLASYCLDSRVISCIGIWELLMVDPMGSGVAAAARSRFAMASHNAQVVAIQNIFWTETIKYAALMCHH